MLGAVIGDVAGSSYEIDEIKALKNKSKVSYEQRIKVLDKNVPLFKENSSYTDDTCLTVALSDAVINNDDYDKYLRKYGLEELQKGIDLYGRSRFGSGFVDWLLKRGRTDSYGNGCAMRISGIAFLLDDLDDIRKEVYKATIPSHNNEEAINSAFAVADAIYMAKNNYSKEEIKKHIEENYFILDFDLENLQRNYKFSMKSYNSVPQAIYAFLVSEDFEDGIRKAISIGGDTDTNASIAGGILEAYYGIPEEIKKDVIKFIPEEYLSVINKLYERRKKPNVKTISK